VRPCLTGCVISAQYAGLYSCAGKNAVSITMPFHSVEETSHPRSITTMGSVPWGNDPCEVSCARNRQSSAMPEMQVARAARQIGSSRLHSQPRGQLARHALSRRSSERAVLDKRRLTISRPAHHLCHDARPDGAPLSSVRKSSPQAWAAPGLNRTNQPSRNRCARCSRGDRGREFRWLR